MTALLELTDLRTGFGSNTVLHGVNLVLEPGRTGVLLGLNGAGKSVTLKTISGLQPAWSGSIKLEGRELAGLEAEDRIRGGLGHVLQSKSVFPTLTVAENLRLGGAMLRDRARFKESLDRVMTIYPRLSERASQLAGSLSGGEQAMLAVGRALMTAPRLLLVDEPSAGLSPKMVEHLGDTLRLARDSGTSMLLVEQNVGFGLALADDVFVMEKGTVVYRERASELDRDRIAALLGIGELLGAESRTAALPSEAGTPKPAARAPRTKQPARRAAPKKAARAPGAPKITASKTATRKAAVPKPAARKATAAKKSAKRSSSERSGR